MPEIFLDFSPFQKTLNARGELLNTARQTEESTFTSSFCQKEQILHLNLLTGGRGIPRLELKNKKISISLIRVKADVMGEEHSLLVNMHRLGLTD